MELGDFQSWFRRPRDRSSARSVSKTCSKKRLPEEIKSIFFLFFFVFGLAAPRIKKLLPKWPPKSSRRGSRAVLGTPREPKIDQLLASGRPGGRAKSCLGFWGASPGAPGRAQEGQGAFRTPPGGSRANLCQKCCTVELSSAGPPKRLHLAWGSQFLHRPKGGSAHSCVQNPLLADVKIENPKPNAAV